MKLATVHGGSSPPVAHKPPRPPFLVSDSVANTNGYVCEAWSRSHLLGRNRDLAAQPADSRCKARRGRRLQRSVRFLAGIARGSVMRTMWVIDFCHRRSAECVEMAETCADSDVERRKAWLKLARHWSRLPEEIVVQRSPGERQSRD
jgi:hypothetical protein